MELTRAGTIESRHTIHAVVSDRAGRLQVWGDGDRPTIPRSAIKAIQALPIVATGAGDACGVTPEELALACASHSAEQAHVEAVLVWLDRLALGEDDLECGADRPLGMAERRRWLAAGGQRRRVLNGCSGKHAGFLTVARHLDVATAGYIERESPVQHLVTDATAALTGLDLSSRPSGIDGCGIPVFVMPLARLAFAMARLVDPADLPGELAKATGPVVEAAQLAFWVSGSGRTEVKVVEAAAEPVVIKTGAEGVFMAALPDRGLGISLKADDGTARAAQAAITALLRQLDAIRPDSDVGLPSAITNKADRIVGETRAVLRPPLSTALRAAP